MKLKQNPRIKFLCLTLATASLTLTSIESLGSAISSNKVLRYGSTTSELSNSGKKFTDLNISDQRREQLQAKLLQLVRSGTESGGGGSSDRDAFYKPVGLALQTLKTRYVTFELGRFEYDLLSLALRAVTIIPTHKQLYDRQGIPVDFYNDPERVSISYNIDKWNRLTELERFQFGLHELYGVLEIADPHYYVSRFLAEVAQATIEENQSNPHNFRTFEGPTDKNPLNVLADYKLFGYSAFITNECEGYQPSFKGQCIVAKLPLNGVVHFEVYLIPDRITRSEHFR